MAKDWSQALQAVLMDAGRVSLPGLGTFQLTPQEALIDQIDRKALPPDSSVSFNPNLVLDDGRLVQYLRDHFQLNAAAATQEVADFSQAILQRIEAGENVQLPGLGHLRRDYKGALQFAAGRNRLDKDHFGLPEVPLEPLVRETAIARPATTAVAPPPIVKVGGGTPPPSSPVSPIRQRDQEQRRLQRIAIWLLGVTALLICAGFCIDRNQRNSDNGNLTGPDNPSTVNSSDDAFTRIPEGDQQTYDPDPATTTPNETSGVDNNTIGTSPTPPPPAPPAATHHTAVIAIGLYGQASNVDRARRRVTNAGYEPYSSRSGGLTRVGVELTYTTEADLRRQLDEVQQRLDIPEAFIMIKDGEQVANN